MHDLNHVFYTLSNLAANLMMVEAGNKSSKVL